MGFRDALRRLAREAFGSGPSWPPCPACGGYCDLQTDPETAPAKDPACSPSTCVPVDLVYRNACPGREERLKENVERRLEYQERADPALYDDGPSPRGR